MKVRESLSLLLAVSGMLILTQCTTERSTDLYIESVEQWRQERLERLKGPRSWLSLAGLYPLQEGIHSVGTADTHAIRFPPHAPRDVGTIHVDSAGIQFIPAQDMVIVLEDGSVFPGGQIDLNAAQLMHHGALYWVFIDRGSYFLRLWDTLSPARAALDKISCYPVDPAWNVTAKFLPAEPGTTVELDDILGQRRPYDVRGTLSAVRADTAFSLIALDGGPGSLFIIFDDATTDIETYPAGRYLDIPLPAEGKRVVLDFNKAYNPPCAFTEFATCLLPPDENRLPFAVRAGEKTVK